MIMTMTCESGICQTFKNEKTMKNEKMKTNESPELESQTSASPTMIAIDRIDLADKDRLRVNDNPDTIEDYEETYRQHMENGVLTVNPFPPCGGYFNEVDKFVPTAGRHRIIAGGNVGLKDFPCIVYPDRKTAIWHGLGDNRKNGLRNSREDERKMIEIALATSGRTNRVIAEQIGCSPSKVDQIKRKLELRKNTQLPEIKTGRDGKEYPAKKTSKATKATPSAVLATEETPPPTTVTTAEDASSSVSGDSNTDIIIVTPDETKIMPSEESENAEWFAKGFVKSLAAEVNADLPTKSLALFQDCFELMNDEQQMRFVAGFSLFLQKKGYGDANIDAAADNV